MTLPNTALGGVQAVPGAAWRALSLPAREQAYSPSSCIGGNYLPFIQAYVDQSQAARAGCVALGAQWHALPYGAQASQRVQVCVPPVLAAGQAAPGLLVFIHGGYWQELSAQESLFAAIGCVRHGVAFAAIDYTLAPQASVGEIVAECRAALVCLAHAAGRLGFDAGHIVVAGSSAGAHLAAMVAWPGWKPPAGGVAPAVRATVLVSGIYELEPLVGTAINQALGLDATTAQAHSPAALPLGGFPHSLVVWGDIETDEFKRQSHAFAGQLVAAQATCQTLQVAGRNHFDVILDLADVNTELGRRTMAFFNAPR